MAVYAHRVLITVGIVTAVLLALLFVWYGSEVVLLIFTGVLLAVFLCGLSGWVRARTSLSDSWALVVVLLGLIGLVAFGLWLLIPTISQQVQQLTQQLPETFAQVNQRFAQLPWAQQLLAQAPQPQQILPQSTNIVGRVTGIFSSALGVVTNLVIIVFVGVYLAADPELYRRGILRLVPLNKRERADNVLITLGHTLHSWLMGRLSIMTINAVLTALSLWFLDVPLPWTLGIITGLLNFIPNIGPILAAVPAILLAFPQGVTQVLYVALLYIIIQNLEGFVLTPLVQQRTVELPPVLILSAQLVLGIFFGFMGLLLAVPVTAVVFVLVKMLYVEDTLGDQIGVKGEQPTQQPSSKSA